MYVQTGGLFSLASNGCLADNRVRLRHWFPVHHPQEPEEIIEWFQFRQVAPFHIGWKLLVGETTVLLPDIQGLGQELSSRVEILDRNPGTVLTGDVHTLEVGCQEVGSIHFILNTGI